MQPLLLLNWAGVPRLFPRLYALLHYLQLLVEFYWADHTLILHFMTYSLLFVPLGLGVDSVEFFHLVCCKMGKVCTSEGCRLGKAKLRTRAGRGHGGMKREHYGCAYSMWMCMTQRKPLCVELAASRDPVSWYHDYMPPAPSCPLCRHKDRKGVDCAQAAKLV